MKWKSCVALLILLVSVFVIVVLEMGKGVEKICHGSVEFRNGRPGEPGRVGGLAIGASVNPFAALDFDSGSWDAYVLIEHGFRSKYKANRYRLVRHGYLKELKGAMNTRYTGSDVATEVNSIVFVRNKVSVYQTAIVLSGMNLEGFQTTAYGFVVPSEDSDIRIGFLDLFEPVCEPVLVL